MGPNNGVHLIEGFYYYLQLSLDALFIRTSKNKPAITKQIKQRFIGCKIDKMSCASLTFLIIIEQNNTVTILRYKFKYFFISHQLPIDMWHSCKLLLLQMLIQMYINQIFF